MWKFKLKLKYLWYFKRKSLTEWELDFVKNLHSFKKHLSLKQMVKVDEIFHHIEDTKKVKYYHKDHFKANRNYSDRLVELDDSDYHYDEVHDFDRD